LSRSHLSAARACAAALAAALLAAAPAAALAGDGSRTGKDISYPQCGHAYPTTRAFGIVGVNGGLANNANPCLAGELAWAHASRGVKKPSQPPAALYINTADPGNQVADWPTPSKGSTMSKTPHGVCRGAWDAACAYLYGEQRAEFSYSLVASANAGVRPGSAPWWLDVETINSWAKSKDSSHWASLNISALQGFVAGLRQSGARAPIGIYSMATDWHAITGLTGKRSLTYFPRSEPNWVAGLGSLAQAKRNCGRSFTGAPVRLAAYRSGSFDGDYACS
jgi:hypothetical protein